MKIIITSKGKTLDSEVDPRFGRGAYFLLIDADSKEFEVLDNSEGIAASHGAGVQAGQRVVNSGATALITGHVGPKAGQAMAGSDVKIYSHAEGTVREMLNKFLAGELKPDTTEEGQQS